MVKKRAIKKPSKKKNPVVDQIRKERKMQKTNVTGFGIGVG